MNKDNLLTVAPRPGWAHCPGTTRWNHSGQGMRTAQHSKSEKNHTVVQTLQAGINNLFLFR